MKMIIFEDRTPLQEVIFGLSSKRILHTPDVVIVKHPLREEMIVLKSRHNDKTTLALNLDFFEVFKGEKREWDDEYEDLYKKNIIIDDSILSERSRNALLKL